LQPEKKRKLVRGIKKGTIPHKVGKRLSVKARPPLIRGKTLRKRKEKFKGERLFPQSQKGKENKISSEEVVIIVHTPPRELNR